MKKFLSVALAFLMLAVMLPVTAMADTTTEVEVTPNTIPSPFLANTTYKFKAGNYGAQHFVMTDKENITLIAESGAKFDSLQISSIDYVNSEIGQVVDLGNSTLRVKGFEVAGSLMVVVSDKKVVVEGNTAAQITVKTNVSCTSIAVNNNKLTGGDKSMAPQGYGIYIVPNITDYDLTINGNTFENIQKHAIGVQGCGDGSAVTAAKSVTVSNNNFISYGVGGGSNRAAFKIWNDTKLAPKGSEMPNAAAVALANSIANGNGNTFSKGLGKNCKVAQFGEATLLDPPTPPEEEGPSTIVIITTPSEDTTPKTEDQKNPTTGANDMVAAAVALMAVSALGAAVLTRKK